MATSKVIKEIVTDVGGNTTIEYSDDTTQKYNVADVVTAQVNPLTGGIENMVSGKFAGKISGRNQIRYAEHIKKGLGRICAAPIEQSSIGFYGHSIVAGVGSGSAEADWATKSLPVSFSRILNSRLGSIYEKGAVFVGPDQQSRWTLGGGAVFDATQYQSSGIGGYRLVMSSSSHTASINVSGTKAIIYATAGASGVVARYTIDGGATQNATPSGAVGTGAGSYFYTFEIAGMSSGDHTIVLMGASSGTYVIVGIEGRSQATSGVVVHRAGLQSMCLADVLACAIDNSDTSGPANWIGAGNAGRRTAQSRTMIDQLGVSMLILMTDVNDLLRGYGQYGYSLSDIRRHVDNVNSFCTSYQIPVLWVIGPWRPVSEYAAGTPFTQDECVAQYDASCALSTSSAIIDLRSETIESQSVDMVIGVHPNYYGTQAAAVALANAVIAASSI